MLESITVKNLALIKESEVMLRPGLNILSGETGAGKSIILGSIRLALGQRAGRDIIRRGEEYALIELIFTSDSEELQRKMEELDIPKEADGTISIQRKIMENRSVCKCNGETISSRALKEIASMLIDIHGQNDTQTLLDARNYRDILDDYGDETLVAKKDQMATFYTEYRRVCEELELALESNTAKDKDIALARFEVEEIEAARLEIGEDETLDEKYHLMKNSQKIAESLGKIHSAINMDSGAGVQIGYSIREMGNVLQYDEKLTGMSESLADAEDILKDTIRSIQDYMENMEFSEQEFRETESRLDTYNHLKDKYGNTVEQVLEYADSKRAFIEKMENYEGYIEELKAKNDKALEDALKCARELSAIRESTAGIMQEKLIGNLKELNFDSIQLRVAVNADEANLGRYGIDDVDFLVSFNMGEPVKSLSMVASGGELSRFMLALKAATADKESIETLIFDEIDSGISGKTAWNVSQKMAVLSKEHQVIAITHLPQIAAMADTHYLIEKRVVEDTTITDIKRLGESERENEIARMLSGGELTETGLSNAKELIENARSCKI
ncbi:MAG: DNA repair protein RecN [Lachnospiraceae bacterium]|nr:DNA repair protein RecN [Candidatus Colinaster scatohippi]